MAELASLRAPTHQAAVTANNARAMETNGPADSIQIT